MGRAHAVVSTALPTTSQILTQSERPGKLQVREEEGSFQSKVLRWEAEEGRLLLFPITLCSHRAVPKLLQILNRNLQHKTTLVACRAPATGCPGKAKVRPMTVPVLRTMVSSDISRGHSGSDRKTGREREGGSVVSTPSCFHFSDLPKSLN